MKKKQLLSWKRNANAARNWNKQKERRKHKKSNYWRCAERVAETKCELFLSRSKSKKKEKRCKLKNCSLIRLNCMHTTRSATTASSFRNLLSLCECKFSACIRVTVCQRSTMHFSIKRKTWKKKQLHNATHTQWPNETISFCSSFLYSNILLMCSNQKTRNESYATRSTNTFTYFRSLDSVVKLVTDEKVNDNNGKNTDKCNT